MAQSCWAGQDSNVDILLPKVCPFLLNMMLMIKIILTYMSTTNNINNLLKSSTFVTFYYRIGGPQENILR